MVNQELVAIRDALYADIPRIVSFLEEQYVRTHFAREGKVQIDINATKSLLVNAIRRHGGHNGGSCFIQVVDSGTIDGLILGTLARVYSIGNKLMVTDIFWVVNEHAPADAALTLMRNMLRWGKSCPSCVEAHCGTTAIIANDPASAGRILRRLGMQHYGNIHRLEFGDAS